MNYVKKWLKKFYDMFLSLSGPPRQIALAFAIGVVISFFPIIGTHTLIVLGLASLLRTNMPAMFLGSWVCNPATYPIQILGSYYVGKTLLMHRDLVMPVCVNFETMLSVGWEVISTLIIGGLVLGIAVAVPTYFIVFFMVEKVRNRKSNRGADS